MREFQIQTGRRVFLSTCALGLSAFTVRGAFADALTPTPKQTDGPFYPDKLPLDTDNDLLIINDSITPAVGTVAHFSGKVLDVKGTPIRNALVEIWQCDSNGAYLHSDSDNGTKRDKNFQGFGRFLTGSTGEYYFRTIKPVPYPGRTPHIHVKVKQGRKELLSTQAYIKGHPGNARDGVLRGLRNAKDRDALMVDFVAIKESKIGEVAAKFDIILGITASA